MESKRAEQIVEALEFIMAGEYEIGAEGSLMTGAGKVVVSRMGRSIEMTPPVATRIGDMLKADNGDDHEGGKRKSAANRLIEAANEIRYHVQACGWPHCTCPEDKPGQITCPSTGTRIHYPYRVAAQEQE